MEYTSNDNRKFIFKFEIKNEEKMIVAAREENQGKIIPDIYKKEFTKDELSNRKEYEITVNNIDLILKQINLSFEKGTASFNVDCSEIGLSYLLFDKFKVDLAIPFYTYTSLENVDNISSYLSHSKFLHLRYQEQLKKIKNLFKFVYVKNTNQNEKFLHILFLT